MGKRGPCAKLFPGLYGTTVCIVFMASLLSWVVYLKYTEDFSVDKPVGRKTSEFSTFVDTLTGKSPVNTESGDQNAVILEEEYRARVTRYQNVCAVRKGKVSSSNEVLYLRNPVTNRSLSYCKVPKTGCTFWKRIYQFLNRTSKMHNISSPFDITRFQAQNSSLVKLHMVRYNLDQMADALRFFFVRDPYTRLMSAYVDKFLLPQFVIWNLFGEKIAQYRNITVTGKHKCITEVVTFAEFIEQIVLSGSRDQHWQPMHTVCDPCKLFPHVIGKQETFSRDAQYILGRVGLQHLMTEYSHKTYVGDEVNQVVDFTFSLRYVRECYSKVEIASRLWKAFQINGYLTSSKMFPERKMKNLLESVENVASAKDIVTKFIIQENKRVGMSRAEHSKQKRNMLLREFSTLSKETMEKLADQYRTDFRMFGYERYPRDLFTWRYEME